MMRCNICGESQFVDAGARLAVRCRSCGSFERTRLLWMAIERNLTLTSDTRVLHLAPEVGLYRRIRSTIPGPAYDVRDLCPENFPFAEGIRGIDLCGLEGLSSNHYDLIIHSHVLEHVPCNIAYTFFHLHRAMSPSAHHLFVVPFTSGRYDECFQDISPTERRRRFGQEDHVRSFGKLDLPAHLGSVVKIDDDVDFEALYGSEALEAANIPRTTWRGLSGHAVIHLRKSDFLLTADP